MFISKTVLYIHYTFDTLSKLAFMQIKKNDLELFDIIYVTWCISAGLHVLGYIHVKGGVDHMMDIGLKNGIGKLSLNSGQDCLQFTLY